MRQLPLWVGVGVLLSSSLLYGAVEWITFQNHLHSHDSHTFSRYPRSTPTNLSYSREGIESLIQSAKLWSVDSLAITDHNTVSHWYDPVFMSEKEVILVRAMEWTNMLGGHASLLGFSVDGPEDAIVPPHPRSQVPQDDYQEMVRQTHLRQGLVVINHPWSHYIPHQWPNDLYGADGIELNLSWWTQPEKTIAWWHQFLRQGEHLFVLGGSDYHVGAPTGEPFHSINLVGVEERSEQDILSALRRGRSQVLRGINSPTITLRLFTSGDNASVITYPGDELRLSPLQSAWVQIEIENGFGGQLILLDRDGIWESVEITDEDFSWGTLFKTESEWDFIRAEIWRQGEIETILNPVYIVTH